MARKAASCAAAPRRGMLRRRNHGSEDGFVLLESMVSIALITIIMAALGTFFTSALSGTAKLRSTQSATRIGESAIETVRGLGAANELSGRAQNSVPAFSLAPTAVQSSLSSMVVAYDTSIAANAVATPVLPYTDPNPQIVNGITYNVNYYVGWCYRAATDTSASTSCATTPTTGIQNVRTVVAVTWTQRGCPSSQCFYVTSIVLNGNAEPLFNFNTTPPPPPNFGTCTNQTSTVGDTVNARIQPVSGPPAIAGICTMTGGVPGFTYSATGLPTGLAMAGDGTITNAMNSATPPAQIPLVAGVYTVKVTVTDAFITSDSATFTWTVYPAVVYNSPGAQTSNVNQTITTLTVKATGGSGAFTYAASGYPTNLSFSTSTGAFSGTPTVVGNYSVTVTATDSVTKLATPVSFSWAVTYPPLLATAPGTQTDYINNAITPLTLTATGGSGVVANQQWSMVSGSLPAGVTLTGNTFSGTPAAIGSFSVTVQVNDSVSGSSNTTTVNWNIGAITITPSADRTATVGTSVGNVNLVAAGGTSAYTWTTSGLPPGLSLAVFNSTTGRITGTPTLPGAYVVTITARDANSFVGSITFNWVVSWTTGQLQSKSGSGSNKFCIRTTWTIDTCNGNADRTWSSPGDGTIRNGVQCLTAAGAAGSSPSLAACNAANAAQHWIFNTDGTIRNVSTGLDLETAASSSGSAVTMRAVTNNVRQQWSLI
jgi:type II secretory pathway pseudopilin PulG